MNITDLKTMIEYHYWARDRLLDAVETLSPDQFNQDLGSSFTSVRETIVHTYAAEWAWHSRWHGKSVTALLTSEAFPDVPSIRRAWSELEQNVRRFVDDLGDNVDRVFDYTLLSGAAGSSPLWQMLQ